MNKLTYKFTISKTYDIVTDDSASRGDFAESGYEYKNEKHTLRSVLSEIRESGCLDNFQDNQTSQSLYCDDYDTDMYTGDETTYALHIDGSERAMKRLNKVIKQIYFKGKKSWKSLKL